MLEVRERFEHLIAFPAYVSAVRYDALPPTSAASSRPT
jgi:hypothetical protein